MYLQYYYIVVLYWKIALSTKIKTKMFFNMKTRSIESNIKLKVKQFISKMFKIYFILGKKNNFKVN